MTRRVIPIKDSTICPRRWNFVDVRLNTGEAKICCFTTFRKIKPGESILNNDYIKERRLEMIKGIQHPDCEYCWKFERQGLQSKRTVETDFNKLDKELYERLSQIDPDEVTIDHPILHSNEVRTFSVSVDNTCDLKCSYCSNPYSSQWAVEDLKHKIINIEQFKELTKEPDDYVTKEFWNLIEQQKENISTIGFTGGEPSINPNFYTTIEKIMDVKTDIDRQIYMFSNGNSEEKQFAKLVDLIERVTKNYKFKIIYSMEALDKQAEYIRYGLEWDRFERNFDHLMELYSKNPNMSVGLGPTLSIPAIPKFDLFIKWAMEKERKYGVALSFHQNTVKSPEWNRTENLPVEYGEVFDRAIEHLRNAPFRHQLYIDFLEASKKSLGSIKFDVKSFSEFYKNYDRTRETNFAETFPELKEYYENNTQL